MVLGPWSSVLGPWSSVLGPRSSVLNSYSGYNIKDCNDKAQGDGWGLAKFSLKLLKGRVCRF